MSIVISVENLGKKYTISHQQREDNNSLREIITNSVTSLSKKIFLPFANYPSSATAAQEDFWALKDVSFEVKQGDRLGIIGRNGAGKSTLLKILSRITEPTTGRVRIKGRVASLLEVGTGFHPELTGRENIYLNGAILGMSKVEIREKFDEIVAFAEIESFLDTPVKRYSSGMYVRLAFAVAAHLEPEILIIDEVLAVGDAQFQKKCLGKMEDVGREGRTVLFVSHNIDAINKLCNFGILIDKGELRASGVVSLVSKKYAGLNLECHGRNIWDCRQQNNSSKILNMVRVLGENMEERYSFKNTDNIYIEFTYTQKFSELLYRLVFEIYDRQERLVLTSSNYDVISCVVSGKNRFVAKINSHLLTADVYSVNVRFDIPNLRKYEVLDKCVLFEVYDNEFHQMGVLGVGENLGSVHVPVTWVAKNI